MKKLLLSAACLLSAGLLSAQYYQLSFVGAGMNPGNVNNEAEQPSAYLTGNYTGYTEILPPASTGWSATQTLPFSFDFNGGPVSTYHVSASGVLTFADTPGTAPTSTNAALPSTMVPDSSLMAWGMNLSGTNDAVVTKTFGTAPNRQQWVIWASASANGLSGTNWTYWGIVLEETTNRMYVVDMRSYSSAGGNTALTVGLQLNQTTAWQIGSAVTSGTTATGGNGSDATDNSYYAFMPGTQPSVEVGLTSIDVPSVVSASSPGTISGVVQNLGSSAVSSWDVVWTDGTNTNSQTFTSTIGANGGSATFSHGDQVSVAAGDLNDITVYVIASGDADNSNDTLWSSVSGAAFTPNRVVFGEEATGTWCGWCPRGAVYMDYMEDTYGDQWIGVAVHNGTNDPMVVPVYDTWMGTKIGGYPSGLVDRDGSEYDPSQFPAAFDDLVDNFGVADISVNAELDDNDMIQVDITAHFAISSTNEYRLAGVVIENGLSGTSSGWAQTNYYAGGGNGAMGGYENLPDPVPAADMVYDHVGRALLGGIDGDANSVPASITAGDSVTYSYTIAKDSDWDISMISIAGILIENASGKVMNAGEDHHVDYGYTVDGVDYEVVDGDTFEYWDGELVPLGTEQTTIEDFKFYPNPASTIVNLDGVTGVTNVTIFDAQGRVVSSMTTESAMIDVSTLKSGFYNMVIENQGKTANAKLTIVR